MRLVAFFFAAAALGLLIGAIARVLKGAIAVGIVLFVLAVVLGGAAGAFNAAA